MSEGPLLRRFGHQRARKQCLYEDGADLGHTYDPNFDFEDPALFGFSSYAVILTIFTVSCHSSFLDSSIQHFLELILLQPAL